MEESCSTRRNSIRLQLLLSKFYNLKVKKQNKGSKKDVALFEIIKHFLIRKVRFQEVQPTRVGRPIFIIWVRHEINFNLAISNPPGADSNEKKSLMCLYHLVINIFMLPKKLNLKSVMFSFP